MAGDAYSAYVAFFELLDAAKEIGLSLPSLIQCASTCGQDDDANNSDVVKEKVEEKVESCLIAELRSMFSS
jgi:hypothetical protein